MTNDTPAPEGLNERQRKFAEFYALTGNALQSAIKAGYAEGSAGVTGNRMLKNANVTAYLKTLGDAQRSDRIATAEERQELLTSIMRGDVFVKVRDATGQETGATTSAPLKERLRAIELLGRMQGDFIERIEHTGDLPAFGLTVVLSDEGGT